MKKYLAFFKISLKKSLEYRARLLIWFLWEIFPAIIMLFFWQAVFQTRIRVGSYDFYSLVIYYFVLMFARNLVLSHPELNFQQEVYRGDLNVYLTRPADLISLKFFYELAYKLLKFLYLIPLLLIGYFLFLKGAAVSLEFTTINVSFFFLSCAISFLLYYLLKMLIGFTAFWLGEIEWLSDLEMLVFWFFGGLLLPLDLLPVLLQKIASFLPFQYIFYLPSQALLGRLDARHMISSLGIQLFWLFLLLVFTRRIYRAGLKVYSAFGG